MSDSFDFLRKHNILVKKENSIFAEICKHYNMSYADINMLDAIYDRNKITEPTILAEELLIPKQTITSMLDKLEKKGYVKRQHNENDRRKVNVMLLPKGEKLLLQVQHIGSSSKRSCKMINVTFANRFSTYIGYIILGLAFGLWAMLVPFVKDRLSVDKAQLGMLLLLIATGAVISMFFTGYTAAKLGCRKTVIISTLLISVCLPVLSVSSSVALTGLFMFLFGMGLGMLDVTLNIQGAIVEESMKKHLMAGFHSMYSFGVFFGILFITYLLKHISSSYAAFAVTALIVILLITIIPTLLTYGGDKPQKIFIKPTRILFVLGMICFIAFVAEGVILDWSANMQGILFRFFT